MIPRETQTQTYWNKFKIDALDLEHLTTVFIEDEMPRTVDELALALVRWRCQQEQAKIEQELTKGTLYQPKGSYDEGETLVFPALSYAVGTVEGMRPGHNPEYGDFQVIQVRLKERKRLREFAAELQAPHRLNVAVEEGAPGDGQLLSPAELYEEYGEVVRQELEVELERSDEFVSLLGRWFPQSLLVEIGVGHLNLVEAILDMEGGGPMPSKAFLKDLDLPAEINESLKVFSLNYALFEDRRFDEVGPAGEILWFLRRMEPAEILHPPEQLRPLDYSYERGLLDVSMLALEQELEDEWSEGLFAPLKEPEELTFVLIYPHWRTGTLPLTPRLKTFFPTGRTERIRFTFRDFNTGETWPGWVIRERDYVFGLQDWYGENELMAGAYLELRRSDEPSIVEIGYQRQRSKREWVRTAVPVKERLTFEMRRRSISFGYDELMVVADENLEALDRLWINSISQSRLDNLLQDIFPQLAKLNPQGTVHAKTLYAGVNVVCRMTPGATFSNLVSNSMFLSMGDNYWLFRK